MSFAAIIINSSQSEVDVIIKLFSLFKHQYLVLMVWDLTRLNNATVEPEVIHTFK